MDGGADDFAAASAKDAVDEGDLKDTVVDFEWVMRGFLSYYFPVNHGWKSEADIVLAVLHPPLYLLRYADIGKCDVLTNFLNYVECHDVFPEYSENIIVAKNLLQIARIELVTNRSPT